MSIIRSYSISKVSIQIECEGKQLAKRVIGAIDDYFFMTKDSSIPNFHNITLRFKNNNNSFSFKAPETAQELYVSSSLHVFKDGDLCYLISGDSGFQLDLRNTLGIGLLDSTFWKRPLKSKQEFLMLSLLWLLRHHCLYALHADGVVKEEVGVLFIGSSGSGKSTTALSLIRQGWGYLSDDVVLLKRTPEGIQAVAFQKRFSFASNLANRYPEIKKSLEGPSFNGQKRFVNINHIYPDGFQPSCFPEVLIFPKIVSEGKSQLIPIDRLRALTLLIESSGGIMVDKGMTAKQMEVIKQLVYQASSYQLLAGQDLYEEPERISEILSEM